MSYFAIHFVNAATITKFIKYQVQITNEDEETLKIIDKINQSDKISFWFVACIFLMMIFGALMKKLPNAATVSGYTITAFICCVLALRVWFNMIN